MATNTSRTVRLELPYSNFYRRAFRNINDLIAEMKAVAKGLEDLGLIINAKDWYLCTIDKMPSTFDDLKKEIIAKVEDGTQKDFDLDVLDEQLEAYIRRQRHLLARQSVWVGSIADADAILGAGESTIPAQSRITDATQTAKTTETILDNILQRSKTRVAFRPLSSDDIPTLSRNIAPVRDFDPIMSGLADIRDTLTSWSLEFGVPPPEIVENDGVAQEH